MAQHTDQAMAKIGSTFFWSDLRRQQQRNRGDHIERAPAIGEPLVEDDLGARYPRGIPRHLDAVEEDFNAAERRMNRKQADADPSGRVLALASLLVIVVVGVLLAMTLAV